MIRRKQVRPRPALFNDFGEFVSDVETPTVSSMVCPNTGSSFVSMLSKMRGIQLAVLPIHLSQAIPEHIEKSPRDMVVTLKAARICLKYVRKTIQYFLHK
jgi:hypothetical protein